MRIIGPAHLRIIVAADVRVARRQIHALQVFSRLPTQCHGLSSVREAVFQNVTEPTQVVRSRSTRATRRAGGVATVPNASHSASPANEVASELSHPTQRCFLTQADPNMSDDDDLPEVPDVGEGSKRGSRREWLLAAIAVISLGNQRILGLR